MHRTRPRLSVPSTVIVCSLALAAATIMSPTAAEATASLRLYPDLADGGGGQLVSHSPFELFIENHGNGGGDNSAYDTLLVVAVVDPGLLDEITLTLPDSSTITLAAGDLTVGTPGLPCTGRSMPPHGVYPASFTTVPLGTIDAGDVVQVTVAYTGLEGLEVHFDAMATGYKNNGDCRDLYNPFGHDVTAVILDGAPPDPEECEVEVEKTADVDQVEIGDEVVFSILANNVGDCELTMAGLTDLIPTVTDSGGSDVAAFRVLATDPVASSMTDTEVFWDIGSFAPGASMPFTMTVVFDVDAAEGYEVVNLACLAAEELDEHVCDEAEVTVGEIMPPEPIGSPGYWCRQIRAALEDHPNAHYTLGELEDFLVLINDGSGVFSELRNTETLELVRVLVCRPNTLSSAAERLMRHLMTLWFNIVSERLDPAVTLGELCQGDEGLPDGADPAWTVQFVLDEAEAALLAGDDDQALNFWKDVIDFVNNASAPEDCDRVHWTQRHTKAPF
jgi:uncharacterized repeat protein (TIGR01451 family)